MYVTCAHGHKLTGVFVHTGIIIIMPRGGDRHLCYNRKSNNVCKQYLFLESYTQVVEVKLGDSYYIELLQLPLVWEIFFTLSN